MAAAERDDRDRGTMERVGRSMGRSMGGMAGRAADAAAGMAGAMIEGAAEVLGGWWAENANAAARTWDEARDQRSRQHFEARSEPDAEPAPNYDDARPYYQLGHTARQNPDYQARGFDDVEPDLRRAAEEGRAGEQSEWPDVRGYVQFGYELDEPRPRSP